MLEDIRESGEEGVCEEQEEDPIRLQLWDAESKDSKVDKGMQDHKDAETRDAGMPEQEGNYINTFRQLLFPHEDEGNRIPMGFWGMQKCC